LTDCDDQGCDEIKKGCYKKYQNVYIVVFTCDWLLYYWPQYVATEKAVNTQFG
jgi:hypothetical protein